LACLLATIFLLATLYQPTSCSSSNTSSYGTSYLQQLQLYQYQTVFV